MLFNFANVLVFLGLACGFVLLSLLLGALIRPRIPTKEKLATYECGELPVTPAWINFNMRFYILAILFIIFDVEIALMFPVGVIFKEWVVTGKGVAALLETVLFILILLLGLVYVWVKGDLEWVKKVVSPTKSTGSEVVSKASSIP